MRKHIILWAVILTALILLLIGCFWLVPNFGTNHFEVEKDKLVDIQTIPTPQLTSLPTVTPQPSPSAKPEVPSSPEPAAIPKRQESKKQESNYAFTLNIKGKKVNVAYGVDETTLKKTPGWLTTSAAPGEDGTCVVYGHRNRKHLRALENVDAGDTIDVLIDGTVYSYEVESIRILDNNEALTIPAAEGKKLILTTCYPFRYSGRAPRKCAVNCFMK